MHRVVAAVLLVTSGLAGCLGDTPQDPTPASQQASPNLTEKVHDVLPVEVVNVTSVIDGKQIHNAVYRPDTDEPVPVFVNFSPYWGDSATERGDAFAQYMIEEYVPRGYAVVLSAVRGTGHSEGCFQIGSDKEIQDTYDVIDRLANADWSNGNVIAGGKSYDSTTQNGLVAKNPHPALEGILHVSGITDMYRYTYRQGVPYGHGPIFNTYYYGQSIHEYGLTGLGTGSPSSAATYEDEDADSLSRAIDDASCTEFPEQQANGVGSGIHGLKTDYWVERDWNRYANDTRWDGSVFFVHGLSDWNVKPDHILPWLDRLPEDVQVKGWLHQSTHDGTGHVYPMRADWNQTMLRWLEHEGKDKPADIDWTIEAESSDGTWRAHDEWPPADVHNTSLDVKRLTARPENGHVTVEGPVPVNASNGPVRYAGTPNITAEVTVTGNPDPVFTAVLYDEGPDGERTWINEAVLRGVYRNGLTEAEPFPQDEEIEVTMPFYPQDDVLEPGHEWVVEVGTQSLHAQPTPAQLEGIDYGDHGFHLQLPLADTDTNLTQPEPVPCFAC